MSHGLKSYLSLICNVITYGEYTQHVLYNQMFSEVRRDFSAVQCINNYVWLAVRSCVQYTQKDWLHFSFFVQNL